MLNLKIIMLGMLVAVACTQAGGAASVVAKKSKIKGYRYSWKTERYFSSECVQGANEDVCRCVLDKIRQQYSEADYWRLEKDLQNNKEHPDYIAYLTVSVEECDMEYTNGQKYIDDIDRVLRDVAYVDNIDRVLREVSELQTTDATVLGGRRDRADVGFNEGYGAGGAGGVGDGLAGLFGGGGGGIATKAKGNIKTPSARDVDVKSGGGSRSAADIMKVVRQRTPGLRQIYDKFLKKKPGFRGRVALKFTIAPEGNIISISIDSSTTGYAEFDASIKGAVSAWTFSKVKSGNTTVTIPFTFSE